jgi:hypothetical protein
LGGRASSRLSRLDALDVVLTELDLEDFSSRSREMVLDPLGALVLVREPPRLVVLFGGSIICVDGTVT